MAKPNPQFNTPLSPSQINAELPFYPLYGVTPDNKYTPISITEDGQLSIGSVTITGPVTVSDVVIKGVDPDNSFTTEDISVYNLGSGNGYSMRSTLFDGGNHLKINVDGSIPVTLTSGSIEIGTVDQGTPNTIANGWPVKPTDGINSQSYTAFGEATISITQPLPGGTNVIGHVLTDSGSTTVVTGNVTIVQPTAANLNATIVGTVTANIGTTNGLALDSTLTNGTQHTLVDNFPSTVAATQSGPWTVSLTSESIEIGTVDQGNPNTLANAWPVELSDGTNLLGTPIHPVRIDPTGTTIQPVSGTITANAGTGNFTVVQPTGTNLHTVVDSGSITIANASIAVTQSTSPWVISGTVTSNIGTTGGLALDTTVAALEVAQGSTTWGKNGILELGAVTTASPLYTTGKTSPLSLTLAGALRVDGSAVTQPVSFSGNVTVVQPTGTNLHTVVDSGSITVANASIAVTQSTSPWVVSLTSTTITGTVAVTQSTSPWVISGTVTANIGTTNGLALDSTVSGLEVSQGSTTSGQKGILELGAVTTASPSYTTGQTSALSLTTAGALRVDASATTQPVVDSADGPVTPGVVASKSILTGGQFNSTLPTPSTGQQLALQTDLNGRLLVAASPLDGYKATYSLSSTTITPPASATDIYILNGSATKTIRVLRVEVTGTQTTAGTITIILVKRSSANSGGTFTTVNAVPYDSTDPNPSSATVLEYSANPTSLGTAVSFIRTAKIFVPGIATTSAGTYVNWDFGSDPGKAIVLRGTAQGLAINLNATTVTGGSFFVTMEWTEE